MKDEVEEDGSERRERGRGCLQVGCGSVTRTYWENESEELDERGNDVASG